MEHQHYLWKPTMIKIDNLWKITEHHYGIISCTVRISGKSWELTTING